MRFALYGSPHDDLFVATQYLFAIEPAAMRLGVDHWNREPLRSKLAESGRLVFQALRHAYSIPDDQTLETTYVDYAFAHEAFANIPLMSTPLDLCAAQFSRSIDWECIPKIIRAVGHIFALMLLIPEALYQAFARTVAKVGIFVYSFFNQPQAEWLRVRLALTMDAGTRFRDIGLRLLNGY
ncbi:MAG: hypothetical protein KGR16_06975 [Verrucomicrobia bacterium]|nr:hypothetical protein [Verrucomicrobiota bacterium]MDE3046775.1 hypothetical protein [Verrucomicrobiota bacterium]